ncbi:MAG: hypothetical protein WAY93_07440 [Atopobiaceae bacterium]|jgi:hypothetical protein
MPEQTGKQPEQSNPSRFLRIVCLVEMVEGGLAALVGVLVLIIGAKGFSATVNMPESATVFVLSGIAFLAYAAVQVLAARSGIQGRYRLGSTLSCVAIALALASLALTLQNHIFVAEQVAGAVLGVVLPVLFLLGVRQSTSR